MFFFTQKCEKNIAIKNLRLMTIQRSPKVCTDSWECIHFLKIICINGVDNFGKVRLMVTTSFSA